MQEFLPESPNRHAVAWDPRGTPDRRVFVFYPPERQFHFVRRDALTGFYQTQTILPLGDREDTVPRAWAAGMLPGYVLADWLDEQYGPEVPAGVGELLRSPVVEG